MGNIAFDRGACQESAVSAPLGTTCEIAQPPPKNPESKRLERWRLQSIARDFLPDERVGNCLRKMRPKKDEVTVLKARDRAHYGNLMVCGSIWICPVCAAKISERRRVELVQGIESWKAPGGKVLMLTQTVPHYDFQPLKSVLEGFTKARRLMRNRKPWKRLAKRIGLKGSVRALEVTYGDNGWHVHAHELLFLDGEFSGSLEELQGEILKMWQSACVSAELDCPNIRGIKIHNGDKAGDYAGKWGMDCEITKAHIKQGRDGNLGPWDMLREADRGNYEFVKTFQEYAKAFKGKHQLEWSKGLRELLGLGVQVSDKELAEEIEEEAVVLGSLSPREWRVVVSGRGDKRGELLEIAASDGWQAVMRFVRGLIESRPCPF
jgi:hypothetical protein